MTKQKIDKIQLSLIYNYWLQLNYRLIKFHRNQPTNKQFIFYQSHTLTAVSFTRSQVCCCITPYEAANQPCFRESHVIFLWLGS